MNSLIIHLTYAEFFHAVSAAQVRMAASTGAGLNAATTYHRTWIRRLVEETCGACGEMAIAKWQDRWFVPGLGTFHTFADLFGDVESRGTDNEKGSLIVRDNDDDDRKFVLALVKGPEVTLAGWLYGAEAKVEAYARDPNGYRPAWFVPAANLRDIETLFSPVARAEMRPLHTPPFNPKLAF